MGASLGAGFASGGCPLVLWAQEGDGKEQLGQLMVFNTASTWSRAQVG